MIRNYFSTTQRKLWLLALIAILTGMFLTVISLLGLCSEECAEGHNWQLFGFPFEAFGVLFFTAAIIIHYPARHQGIFNYLQLALLSSAIGAEGYFIYVQKFLIGQWCPVCLGIATCLSIAFIALGFREYLFVKRLQEKTMLLKWSGLTSVSAMVVGFVIAFLGVTKHDAMEAAVGSIKDQIAFGEQSSPIEVYIFTDWACPACRELEPALEKIIPQITSRSKVFFIDHAIHPETLNFIPYNLSFIVNDKPNYLKLRSMLTHISERTGAPTEEQITEAASRLGVTYTQLNYADVALAIKYYKNLGDKFEVKGTPTMVIINTDSKKGKKLAGNDEITELNVINSIQQLNTL